MPLQPTPPAGAGAQDSHSVLALTPDWRAHFLDTWRCWRASPRRPARLHVVAVTDAATPDAFDPDADLTPPAHTLAQACKGLLPGMHRFAFDDGAVQLTLCIGPLRHCLHELDSAFDAMDWLGRTPQDLPDASTFKALARLARVGTRLTLAPVPAQTQADLGEQLRPCGFVPVASNDGAAGDTLQAQFRPGWTPRTPARSAHRLASHRHCVVLGGGLAGAAVAASLARRGWQVQVLDAGTDIGAGASGLPAGLAVPHVTPDDNPLSRIIRAGLRATTQRCAELLPPGLDWQASGVLEHCVGDKRHLPEGAAWPRAGHEWSTPATPAQRAQAGVPSDAPALWHDMALRLRPVALVRAQLNLPGVHWRRGVQVHRLLRQGETWQLLDAQDQCVAQAPLVIVAAGYATRALLDGACHDGALAPALPLNPLRGQMSWGRIDALEPQARAALPPFPVNGHGSFIHGLPCPDDAGAPGWFCGSTFERAAQGPTAKAQDHDANFQRLQRLLPALAERLQAPLAPERAQAWAGLRCTLPDHRPAVGPLHDAALPGLWVCTGLGTRGLSVSVLCGELIAAWLHGEPLPLEASLAHKLAAGRFRPLTDPARA